MTEKPVERRVPGWLKPVVGVAGLLLFILALELLKDGAGGLGPVLRGTLRVNDMPSALGFGWLFAYVILSGSPVAAISLTFFANGIIDGFQTFLMVTGSRLGAAFIVLFVGYLYHLRGQDRATSLEMGVLSLLVTYTVYLPAIPVGLLLLRAGWLDGVRFGSPGALTSLISVLTGPVVEGLSGAIPTVGVFLVGVGVLLGSFRLFDAALPEVKGGPGIRNVEAAVFRPTVMFALGVAITLLTLSVSVSLGLLVPLATKGYARRENVIPYIMGANVSTFIDTLFAALLLDAPGAFSIVLASMLSATAVSVVLIFTLFRQYERTLLAAVELILESRWGLTLFMATIVAVPVLLIIT